ncbi:hypothetical protein D5086_023726 [Populus alba]|uniref:Uncharacterized protein n=1 Tax=Populus alba TaxID=43335 RepID=A0ACC4BAS9_POPAL
MGAGSSHDEASESQQTGGEPSHARPQYNEETSTEAKQSETKLKTVEKAPEAKPLMIRQEKAADVKLQSKTVKEVKLPHNSEAILRDADSPVDRSSVDKLYDQLSTGVFLNQKRKKYWVEKKCYSNCFMLFAKDLSITWGGDARYWKWPSIRESGFHAVASLICIMRISSTSSNSCQLHFQEISFFSSPNHQFSYDSDVTVDVAELLDVCWLEIYGKFNTKMLSPGVLYEVVFVIKLKDPAYGWGVPVNVSLVLPNGYKQERKENLQTKTREQWIEVPVGEFITSPENVGEIQFGMHEYDGGEWKRGLVIKGIAIRPKT